MIIFTQGGHNTMSFVFSRKSYDTHNLVYSLFTRTFIVIYITAIKDCEVKKCC